MYENNTILSENINQNTPIYTTINCFIRNKE